MHRIASLGQRELSFENPVPKQRDVTFYIAYPDSSVRVRSEAMSRRNLRSRELFSHFKIADAHQFSAIAYAFCPNIAVDILGHCNDQSKRLVIWSGDWAEAPVVEQIKSIVHSHPQVPSSVFE